MSHTYAQNVIHVVFSTKDRRKIISREFQPTMWAYVAGICKKHAIFVLSIGGSDDHIHLLIQIPPALSLAKAALAIKSNSSRWVNDQGNEFAWQEGYAAFSVSSSNVPAVIRYIRNQESHHRRMDFDAELLALLKKHGIEFNPDFVFG
jgi:REP element-mobilizing transposase RayT